MIKVVGCLTRRQGMDLDEFHRYWKEAHGPLAATLPGLRRYVQSHTLPEWYARRTPPAYDGIAELWFDDWAAWKTAAASPEWQALGQDELNFIDHSRSCLFVTDEYPVVT